MGHSIRAVGMRIDNGTVDADSEEGGKKSVHDLARSWRRLCLYEELETKTAVPNFELHHTI
jgi:hypothetical protein